MSSVKPRWSRIGVWGLLVSLSLCQIGRAAEEWQPLAVPGVWEETSSGKLEKYDGIAWYRCFVKVPVDWKGRDLQLVLQSIDNAYEAYVNGQKIGGEGVFPPSYKSGLSDRPLSCRIPAELVQPDEWNLVAVRIYDHEGKGGFKGLAPYLGDEVRAIELKGEWLFRTGDNAEWAKLDATGTPSVATFTKREEVSTITKRGKPRDVKPPRLSLADSLKALATPDDLEVEQVLTEPTIAQPVFLNFDERGRMWVMNYLQYPNPAGLKIVSKDFWWRAVYDKQPLPPPHGTKGIDKITIHEDTDGDGKYDKHKVFIDNLNIATAFVQGRGGLWVLNPPALLFYPDKDQNDLPDGDPEVHLLGFGLEDPHSVVNSLRWGPDGWLYAAQGSTVTGTVLRPGLDKAGVFTQGQNIWRYHPETRRYEVFSEGGGNAFGVDIDAQGRIFSGHNGGDTRGFHYMQGAYLQKGFNKHGPLTNPYSFGYFPAIPHHNVPRFTHCFAIYDGGRFPEKYKGVLFGVAPLLNHVVMSDVSVDGSTFRTKDIGYAINSTDTRFMPVDIKHGPDGWLYVADWCDAHRSHIQFQEGYLEADNGRVYRLKTKGATTGKPEDLGAKSTADLVGLLSHPNIWTRQMAVRLLGDRRDPAAIPLLTKILEEQQDQTALEAVWGLHASGGFNEEIAAKLLKHGSPFVRLWTVRLLGDDNSVSSAMGQQLADLAQTETNVEARSQLAATAKRLPSEIALAIAQGLIQHKEDVSDPRLPLQIWWALEAQAGAHTDQLLAWLKNPEVWKSPIVEQQILSRVMRRYAATGTRKDLLVCAQILGLSPNPNATKQLMTGFEEAYQGRSLANLPDELVAAIAKSGGGSPALKLRQGDPQVLADALKLIADPTAPVKGKLEFVQILGQVKLPVAVPVLVKVLGETADPTLQKEVLTALQLYPEESIGAAVLARFGGLSTDVQATALTLLTSRKPWAAQLVHSVEAGQVAKEAVPLDVVRKLTVYRDAALSESITRLWGSLEGASTMEMQEQIERLMAVVKSDAGNPYEGKKLFTQHCSKCHTLFAQGGQIGPDLTTFKRDDIHNMLINIVNPSGEIREGFNTILAVTADGRSVTGFLVDQDSQVLVLRGLDGQNISLPKADLEELIPQRKSLMPENLLKELSEQQVRDLFGYLRSSQPLP